MIPHVRYLIFNGVYAFLQLKHQVHFHAKMPDWMLIKFDMEEVRHNKIVFFLYDQSCSFPLGKKPAQEKKC